MAWTEVGENSGAWVCEYYAHTFGVPANAMEFRLNGEELAVISPPVGTREETFAETDSLGRLTAIVATNDYHNLGLAEWPARYPDARTFVPEIALPDRQPFKTMFWIARGAPGIRLNRMYAKMVVKDSRAIAAAAPEALDGVPIIVPVHGAPLTAAAETATGRDLVQAAAR